MIKKFAIAFLCLLMGFACLFPWSVAAKNSADIVDIEVDQNEENLEVSFQIQNCFTPKMEEAIRSGVKTTFRVVIILDKPGFLFFRSRLLDISLERTIRYHRLKNEFRVVVPESRERVKITKDFEEAKRWMSDVKELTVMPLWRLQKNQSYQLLLKAELSKVQLPLFFRYIFFFVSLWDFETDWHKVTFSL